MEKSDDNLNDEFKACRTCGVYVVNKPQYLRPLFTPPSDDPKMADIRLALASWNLEVNASDGHPQNICCSCIDKFNRMIELKNQCIKTQEQFHNVYTFPQPLFFMKKEKIDEEEQCNFIYVDDIEDEFGRVSVPFNFQHLPIKEEVIEEATVPNEEPSTFIDSAASEIELFDKNFTAKKDQTVSSMVLLDENLRPMALDTYSQRITSIASVNFSEDDFPMSEESSSMEMNYTENGISQISHPIDCQFCPQTFNCQPKYIEHLRILHDVKDFVCNICGKTLKDISVSRWINHLKCHSIGKRDEKVKKPNVRVECEICYEKILEDEVGSHMRNHAQSAKWQCPYCGDDFNVEDEREIHIWQVHATEDDNLVGDTFHDSNMVSNELFNESNIINVMSESTDGEEEFSCNNTTTPSREESEIDFKRSDAQCDVMPTFEFSRIQCTKSFEKIEELCDNAGEHSAKDSELICHICSKTFTLYIAYKRHLKTKHINKMVHK